MSGHDKISFVWYITRACLFFVKRFFSSFYQIEVFTDFLGFVLHDLLAKCLLSGHEYISWVIGFIFRTLFSFRDYQPPVSHE